MIIPDFSLNELNHQYRDAGDAFQAFVCELLKSELPNLRAFPALGKDGGIDFSHTDGEHRVVGECKFAEKNDFDTARDKWAEIEKKLRKHLSLPEGPTKGQAQYQPWYKLDPAISTYYFCININLSNLNQVDALEQIITLDFRKLAADFSHLSHLKDIRVQVIDWGKLKELLKEQPFLFFLWFKKSLITGLEPLDAPSQRQGFRAYLGNDKLPYYSIREHKGKVPDDNKSSIPAEEELLDFLEQGRKPGIIITGSGGLGKSRLSLQLARMAEGRNWPVFRVRRIDAEKIEQLARIVGTVSPALLIFDYVETQDDFAQITQDMVQINDTTGCRLLYVASCRSSYYKAAVKGRIEHREVNLDQENDWLKGYRRHAVRHILATAGIPPTEDHLRICRDIPVLAVFMAYLRENGRDEQLHELIHTEDFGKWIVKRMDAAFGKSAGPDLAKLASFFPLPREKAAFLDRDRFYPLFSILAEDGWIEELEWEELYETPAWGTVHDVLADGVMLAHLGTVARTADYFVADLLQIAVGLNALPSALTSLQRIVSEEPLRQINWLRIFSTLLEVNPTACRNARTMILHFTGLTPQQKILLLDCTAGIWEGAEEEVETQNALGWLARSQAKGECRLSTVEQAILNNWLHKAAERATRSNYILTWGLRLYPETFKPFALNWFRNNPVQFQTHYLLVAWLEKRLPADEARQWLEQWSAKNAAIPHFSFLARAWLVVGGDSVFIRPFIRAWLDVEKNRVSSEAQFVYRSWLDATVEWEFVKNDIRQWLDFENNRVSPEAQFVYRSWLDATKDATKEWEFFKNDIRQWLDVENNRVSPEADFVYRSWLDATKDGEFVKNDIRQWLDVENNRVSSKASFVYQSWLDATKEWEFIKNDIRQWLDFENNSVSPKAQFVCRAWLESGGKPEIVQEAAISWLRQYHENKEAVYITKFLVKLPRLPDQAVLDIITWCGIHIEDVDAPWRLSKVARHVRVEKTAAKYCTVCQKLIEHHIANQRNNVKSAQQIDGTISLLQMVSHNNPGIDDTVDKLFLQWLRHPDSYGRKRNVYIGDQNMGYIERFVNLIMENKLDIIWHREAISRFLQWVDMWQPDRKAGIREVMGRLRKIDPSTDLWDKIHYI